MHVDHLIIGAGPSGLACALRLAISGAKVALIEKHTKVGGLNSFYSRPIEIKGEKSRLELDVGLHALTNYVDSKNKKSTLNRLFRSLRLERNEFDLCEQNFSWIIFGDKKLVFTNSINCLTTSIEKEYPSEVIGWDNLLVFLKNYNEFATDQPNYVSAKIELKKYFKNEEFIHHLMFPVLTYGSPWEEDMDFNLFVCIFRSMFLEGLCRPRGGIRVWWKNIMTNIEKYQVQMLMGEQVQQITTMENGKLRVTTSKGEIVANQVFSSAGLIQTQTLMNDKNAIEQNESLLGFVELTVVFDEDFSLNDSLPTLAFCALDKQRYYHATQDSINTAMAIFCFPSRYQGEQKNVQGMVRMTCMTNPKLWFAYSPEDYKKEKILIQNKMIEHLVKQFPLLQNKKIIFSDIFTPKTIHKYTLHKHGSLYGSTLKLKDGVSSNPHVFYIGADQGYPGITGSMLSGITMANFFGIMNVHHQQDKTTIVPSGNDL